MTNLTLTINLDSLTATQLAGLQVAVLAGMSGNERKDTFRAISAAGRANCGDDYPPEYKRVSNFLLNLDKGEYY
jgi:hypothetical protein